MLSYLSQKHFFDLGMPIWRRYKKVFVLLFSKSNKKKSRESDIISTMAHETTGTESLLLDSSLISKYEQNLEEYKNRIIYDCKIIKCGDYIQAYYFSDKRSKLNKDNKDIKLSKLNIKDIDIDNLYKESRVEQPKTILLSNAIRSNLSCQRIAKTNRKEWETFITLTFENTDSFDITDISQCNKKFNQWVSNIRKLKKDFKYLAVPEFQKERGKKYGVEAVHYHVLTNIGKEHSNIIYPQEEFTEKQLEEMTVEQRSKCYDVKYWNKGFARVDFIKNDYKKIYGYICKYMTKDIDNKLFGKKRYFYSQNLERPFETYLNLSNEKDFDYFMNLLKDSNIEYKSTYEDIYTKNTIEFIETFTSSDNI